jgi:hypothetical protein
MGKVKVYLLIALTLFIIMIFGLTVKLEDCKATWEKYGETMGAACFDKQHQESKLEGN